jgi:putative SOS response-associated peptidase YedK
VPLGVSTTILAVLVPYPSHEMRAHQVATLVNKVANDGAELIEALSG